MKLFLFKAIFPPIKVIIWALVIILLPIIVVIKIGNAVADDLLSEFDYQYERLIKGNK